MEQCMYCRNRIFFKPLPDETFTCCSAYGEQARDIDLVTGVSPAIKKHGLKNVPCERFSGGMSVCPLLMKEDGECFLRKAFGMEG